MDAVEQRTTVGTGIQPAHVSGRGLAIVGIGIAGLVLVVALVMTTLGGGQPRTVGTDTSYDQVETLRVTRGLAASANSNADDSYDRIESLRGGAAIDGDHGYDQIEQVRGTSSSQ